MGCEGNFLILCDQRINLIIYPVVITLFIIITNFSLIGKGNGSKLTITCFGENCGYNDETSFCFEVYADVDEEVECYSPDDKCCAGGGKWYNFPAGRTESKCGSLNGPDTMIKCKTASGHMDSMSIFDG